METFLCVRCGRLRTEHDINLVLETEAFWAEIGAIDITVGFKLSLLDCIETKRPEEYVSLIGTNFYQFGDGAGYVSPDPAEEDRLFRKHRSVAVGDSYVRTTSGRIYDMGL